MSQPRKYSFKMSKIFEKFKNIPKKEHYNYITYCNQYTKEINDLEFEEYIEIKLGFVHALYHLERTELFHKITQQTIDELLNQEEFTERYKEIYCQILEIKAQQLKDENRETEAQRIYKNLLSLQPNNRVIRKKLYSSIFLMNQYANRKTLGIAMFSLIISLILNIANQLFINPILPDYQSIVSTSSVALLCLSLIIIITSNFNSHFTTQKEISKIIIKKNKTTNLL